MNSLLLSMVSRNMYAEGGATYHQLRAEHSEDQTNVQKNRVGQVTKMTESIAKGRTGCGSARTGERIQGHAEAQ
eukprot:3279579-Pyramimonas_sp.AAC.1